VSQGKKLDATIVLGVNDGIYDNVKHQLVSNASCTTNCVALVVKVLNDARAKDLRRACAAAMSIIPTTTGMTSAIREVLPEIKGKIDSTAFRVPTPDVSLIDVSIVLKAKPSAEEINTAFKDPQQAR
jgi:glyceraldehyde 3-phosphate dehydrogenase